MNIRSIDISGMEYPALLREAERPPRRLFVAGGRLEPAPHIAVVGTRRPTRYGLGVARVFAREISARGAVVVSGMARGIDSAAHEGALEAGGPTVAVLGCGPDICYPLSSRDLHLRIPRLGSVVSEYEPGTPPLKHHFPARNRIIAGMSLAVVIVEGRLDGGAMITARKAMDAGREVFAVPGPIHSTQSEGPHLLIRDGAHLITSVEEIFATIGWDAPTAVEAASQPSLLTPDESRILGVLEASPMLLERVARDAGMPVASASAMLARLEIRGLVARHPGSRFSLGLS